MSLTGSCFPSESAPASQVSVTRSRRSRAAAGVPCKCAAGGPDLTKAAHLSRSARATKFPGTERQKSMSASTSAIEEISFRILVESRCGAVAVGRTYLLSASFVWRCLSGSTLAPFPHPAHRTGQADLPHPALGQDFTPLLSRATPSAVSEPLRS